VPSLKRGVFDWNRHLQRVGGEVGRHERRDVGRGEIIAGDELDSLEPLVEVGEEVGYTLLLRAINSGIWS
jgi:hypothetical protein